MIALVKKGLALMLLIGIVWIFVFFQDNKTSKQLWTSLQDTFGARIGHQPTSCACDKCVTENDDHWFMERFNKSLNPFLTRENNLSEGPIFRWWKRLQSDKTLFPDYRMVEDTLFKLFPHNHSFMDARPGRCRTCAVVGNSVNLLGSRYGPIIDFNDVVIRFNHARTKGYEGDVGTKTTIRIMYPESAVDVDDDIHLVFFPFKTTDLRWLISAFTDGSITFTYTRVKAKIKANKDLVKVINPYFMKYVHETWLEKHGFYPSTGFMGFILSLHICDEVNVFGFGADQNGNWRHYWEDMKNKRFGTGFHSGGQEYKLIQQLSERQKIKFFRGW